MNIEKLNVERGTKVGNATLSFLVAAYLDQENLSLHAMYQL
jgi:hypothetical protein